MAGERAVLEEIWQQKAKQVMAAQSWLENERFKRKFGSKKQSKSWLPKVGWKTSGFRGNLAAKSKASHGCPKLAGKQASLGNCRKKRGE
ncbi:MAG: hypothetical protein PHS82_06500 [Lachnospiraceae bacterium]|nr:hypothetical protein [Lachnospiraceae bacterium]